MGKALRLLHERLSSKIANGVHVESNGLVSHGGESTEVLSGGVLSNGFHSNIGCDGLGHSVVESSSILINSSV